MQRARHLPNHVATRLRAMLGGEAAAGVILILVAVAAVWIANSPLAHDYHDLFHGKLAWTPIARLDTLHLWINDALMAVFFFVVGLEIKREVLDGELSSRPAAVVFLQVFKHARRPVGGRDGRRRRPGARPHGRRPRRWPGTG